MSISSSQLNTWSHQGAITTSSLAYASIRNALLAPSSQLAQRKPEIFLQGSYANTTNIYGDSDVDVVVLYGNSFHYDLSGLSPEAQLRHAQAFPVPATYTWTHLRNDVLTALRSHFGQNAVTPGSKSIEVITGHGRMTADVLPALQFRRYASFVDQVNLTAHWGIQFFDSAGSPVVNYPKYHSANGEAKNHAARTGGQYKSTIRIIKNLRNWLVSQGHITDGIAPSYFLEGALYNVPDQLFVGSVEMTVPAIINYLYNAPYGGFLCQNGVVPLIGAGATQWSEERFAAFVSAAYNALG